MKPPEQRYDAHRNGWMVNGVFVDYLIQAQHRKSPVALYIAAWHQWFYRWADFTTDRFTRVI